MPIRSPFISTANTLMQTAAIAELIRNASQYFPRLRRPLNEKSNPRQSMKKISDGWQRFAARPAKGKRLAQGCPRQRSASVAEQFVDRGLGAGALVDSFHDHRARERRAGRTVRQRPAGQGARHYYGIFRHLAHVDLAGSAIDDFGRLT